MEGRGGRQRQERFEELLGLCILGADYGKDLQTTYANSLFLIAGSVQICNLWEHMWGTCISDVLSKISI